MRAGSLVFVVSLLAIASATPALADVVPPDVGACLHKKDGAACAVPDGQSGACTPDTCVHARSVPVGDGGIEVRETSWDCLRCVATSEKPAAKASCSGCVVGGTGSTVFWGIALTPLAVTWLLRRRRNRGPRKQ